MMAAAAATTTELYRYLESGDETTSTPRGPYHMVEEDDTPKRSIDVFFPPLLRTIAAEYNSRRRPLKRCSRRNFSSCGGLRRSPKWAPYKDYDDGCPSGSSSKSRAYFRSLLAEPISGCFSGTSDSSCSSYYSFGGSPIGSKLVYPDILRENGFTSIISSSEKKSPPLLRKSGSRNLPFDGQSQQSTTTDEYELTSEDGGCCGLKLTRSTTNNEGLLFESSSTSSTNSDTNTNNILLLRELLRSPYKFQRGLFRDYKMPSNAASAMGRVKSTPVLKVADEEPTSANVILNTTNGANNNTNKKNLEGDNIEPNSATSTTVDVANALRQLRQRLCGYRQPLFSDEYAIAAILDRCRAVFPNEFILLLTKKLDIRNLKICRRPARNGTSFALDCAVYASPPNASVSASCASPVMAVVDNGPRDLADCIVRQLKALEPNSRNRASLAVVHFGSINHNNRLNGSTIGISPSSGVTAIAAAAANNNNTNNNVTANVATATTASTTTTSTTSTISTATDSNIQPSIAVATLSYDSKALDFGTLGESYVAVFTRRPRTGRFKLVFRSTDSSSSATTIKGGRLAGRVPLSERGEGALVLVGNKEFGTRMPDDAVAELLSLTVSPCEAEATGDRALNTPDRKSVV